MMIECEKDDNVVRQMKIITQYNEEPKGKKCRFCYKVNEDSQFFKESNADLAAMELIIENCSDYEHWHKNLVPLSLAFSTMGLDSFTLTDEQKKDTKIIKEATERSKWFIPISEEEYNLCKEEE